MRDINK
ncbi:hypothetical protein bas29_0039 [Escherichia phage SuperGirl]|nr:hypothetical protein bas29_0039 [Escherichia phage SuperGirl]